MRASPVPRSQESETRVRTRKPKSQRRGRNIVKTEACRYTRFLVRRAVGSDEFRSFRGRDATERRRAKFQKTRVRRRDRHGGATRESFRGRGSEALRLGEATRETTRVRKKIFLVLSQTSAEPPKHIISGRGEPAGVLGYRAAEVYQLGARKAVRSSRAAEPQKHIASKRGEPLEVPGGRTESRESESKHQA